MRRASRRRAARAAAAALALAAVLAAAVALRVETPRARADAGSAAAASSAVTGAQPLVFAGPGGRVALTSWRLREDPANRGLARGLQRGGFAGRAVTVPYTLHAASWVGRGGEANYDGSVAWFETTLSVREEGEYAVSFSSASFVADVWIDGRHVASHRGAYLPFEARSRLSAGDHALVVRVDWRDPTRQDHEGFHRTWFNWGGLQGPVEAREIGESELSEPTVRTHLSGGGTASVRVGVLVRNNGPERSITPEGELLRGSSRVPLPFAAISLGHGETAEASTTVSVPEAALWSPSHPDLYQLDLDVGAESSYSARVGLRELGWRGGHLFLNGSPLLLHGATVQQDAQGHGDSLSATDEAAIVSELKAIHANAARVQHPLDPTLLERLDAAGILVWQGIGPVEGAGNWFSNGPSLLAAAERQAEEGARAEELHPSVIAWNIVDEIAQNGHDAAERSYVHAVSRWLHAHDPTRMVAIDVWGDHPPAVAGSLYAEADAIAETDYSGWYDQPRDTPAQLASEMRARLRAMERTFPGRVLVISEFGAESNTLNASASPGGYGYQAQLLAEHIGIYRSDPAISGMLVWVLRDYPLNPRFQGGSIHFVLPRVRLIEGLNQKGLFTYSGQPKPAAAAVGRLFATLPTG
jgi:hypothetical protein